MKLVVKGFNLRAGKPIAFLHERDALALGLRPGDRISIRYGPRAQIALIDVVTSWMKKGEIALSEEILTYLKSKSGHPVEVTPSSPPHGHDALNGRIQCAPYTSAQLKQIMQDIVANRLSEAEIAYFISGVHYCGMTLHEITGLIDAMVSTGRRLSWGHHRIADKHSIGGIPGNRTTPIVVAICAAAGIIMPKTSSRAITSAAGTADTIESIARVDFSLNELKKIVKKAGACLAWGGALGLAPADDKLIKVEKMLNLDPEPQLLASILSKKRAVGSTDVLIDIPYGSGAKVSKEAALELKQKFIKLGTMLKMKVSVVLTDGSQPIGNGIGPMLEMRDVLKVLRQENSPRDLEDKSLMLAGTILEMMGKAHKGKGKSMARTILTSGKAFDKFNEIIVAQHGSIISSPDAPHSFNVRASRRGKIVQIRNREINLTARVAGCPLDKRAGVYLHHHVGSHVQKGDILMTVYAESKYKLDDSRAYIHLHHPIVIE